METYRKLESLKQYFADLGSVAVAFSGGADSTFMLQVAHEVLKDKVVAFTADSAFFPQRELKQAKQFCAEKGIEHIVFSFEELKVKGLKNNPENRCYLCKYALLSEMKKITEERGIKYLAEGSNADDENDYRPGLRAVAELEIKSPLREVKLTKREIRDLSKEMGLPTWNKPSFACLASRFVYGEMISPEKLKMIDRAEQLLLDLGFHQVRVRMHGTMARIEILPDEFNRIVQSDIRQKITDGLLEYGFSYVTLDLKGYRAGSMNEPVLK